MINFQIFAIVFEKYLIYEKNILTFPKEFLTHSRYE